MKVVSINGIILMNHKHRHTIRLLFENPIRSNIAWASVETLLIACGAEISEGEGSRLRVMLNGVRAVFHRPHPQKEIDKGAIKSVRRFLMEAGVANDDL